MIEILHRYSKAVLYKSDLAKNAKEAVVEAVRGSANLSGASLSWADLSYANLIGANLSGASLSWAKLIGANLSRADLSWANLSSANLIGADLSRADLSYANLIGADLSRADLSRANLAWANLSRAEGLFSRPITPLQIGGSRHWVIVRQDGYITIGCLHRLLTDWEKDYEQIGKEAAYSPAEIAEYKLHIQYCREWMEMYGVVDPVVNLPEMTKEPK